jgi:hypothetical protein
MMIKMKRSSLQRLVRFLLKILTRAEFLDSNQVPTTGGVILAINHLSHLDTPLLFVNPVRLDITALVTTKYKQYEFIRWFTDTAQGIWINRDIADFSAIRSASKVLKGGRWELPRRGPAAGKVCFRKENQAPSCWQSRAVHQLSLSALPELKTHSESLPACDGLI